MMRANPFPGEGDAAQDLAVASGPHGAEALARHWRGGGGLSVMATSLFGSAPWSPFPLTVEVTAQIVTVPLRPRRPVMLRRPSVAGAQGSPVAALSPAG
jgi:hypothetical protein